MISYGFLCFPICPMDFLRFPMDFCFDILEVFLPGGAMGAKCGILGSVDGRQKERGYHTGEDP